jgi:phospholipid/cholesterol/gamma-HCH transport system substrate-binding protein
VSQGIPPDSRVNPDANIYGPLDGTAPPAGAPGADTPPPMPTDNQPAPAVVPTPGDAPAPSGAVPPAAPSSYGTNDSEPSPSVAVAPYDPRTGQYGTPDGHVYRQSDLVAPGAAKTWKDLVFNA